MIGVIIITIMGVVFTAVMLYTDKKFDRYEAKKETK